MDWNGRKGAQKGYTSKNGRKKDTAGSKYHRKKINTKSKINPLEEDKVIPNNNGRK